MGFGHIADQISKGCHAIPWHKKRRRCSMPVIGFIVPPAGARVACEPLIGVLNHDKSGLPSISEGPLSGKLRAQIDGSRARSRRDGWAGRRARMTILRAVLDGAQEPHADLDLTAHAVDVANKGAIGSTQHGADMMP